MGSGNFGDQLQKAVVASVVGQIRERFSSIRHPKTGEFPRIVVYGDTLEDLRIRVEGSQELLEIVRSRFSPQDAANMTFVASTQTPKAFLSYAWEDHEIAKKIAEGLQANGVKTWWAEWEIGAGDSIRRKIDAGLGDCTHFIVLLTPTSITRPWVNEEIDAGFVRKIADKCRFMPVRHGLAVDKLPPLMSGMLSPEIDADASSLSQLVNDIFGVSKKPALGQAPHAMGAVENGYSIAANKVAELFVRKSRHGQFADPQLTTDQIATETGLTDDDVTDALHELRAFFNVSFSRALPKATLYAEFDENWMDWKPSVDARRLAADMLNDASFPGSPATICERYGWQPRQLNAAISYLKARDAIRVLEALGSGPFVVATMSATDATRRFVKSQS